MKRSQKPGARKILTAGTPRSNRAPPRRSIVNRSLLGVSMRREELNRAIRHGLTVIVMTITIMVVAYGSQSPSTQFRTGADGKAGATTSRRKQAPRRTRISRTSIVTSTRPTSWAPPTRWRSA